jgi:hypothetical protein
MENFYSWYLYDRNENFYAWYLYDRKGIFFKPDTCTIVMENFYAWYLYDRDAALWTVVTRRSISECYEPRLIKF